MGYPYDHDHGYEFRLKEPLVLAKPVIFWTRALSREEILAIEAAGAHERACDRLIARHVDDGGGE